MGEDTKVENVENVVAVPEEKPEGAVEEVATKQEEPDKAVEEIKVDEPKTEDPEKVEEPEKKEEVKAEPEKVETPKESDEADKPVITQEVEQLTGTVKSLESKVAGYEAVLTQIMETKKAKVPEEFLELIPEGDVATQLAWLNKAEERGLFNKVAPEVQVGKPTMVYRAENAVNKELTATQKLSNSFSEIFNKK